MNTSKVKTLDDLPELPLEKVLSYLSLVDRLKARAVCRGLYQRIKICKVKSICCSEPPSGFLWKRLLGNGFAPNFVNSPRIDRFLAAFAPTILSDLKCLRLCYVTFSVEHMPVLVPAINSFYQLERLDLIWFNYPWACSDPGFDVELKLPMLQSIHFEYVRGIRNLTLDTPRLKQVKLVSSPSVDLLIHRGTVERLLIDQWDQWALGKSTRTLKYLHVSRFRNHRRIDSDFLSYLEQLKELHVDNYLSPWFFEQILRLHREDLKVYYNGHLLDRLRTPAMRSSRLPDLDEETFVYLAENRTRLADEIAFCYSLCYTAIEPVEPDVAIDILRRYTDLDRLSIGEPVENIERFLSLLKHFPNITTLEFDYGWQPQELFDRLPEHCAVQRLTIVGDLLDYDADEFLFRLKHLIHLELDCYIEREHIRKLFNQLEFFSRVEFRQDSRVAAIGIPRKWTRPGRFQVAFEQDPDWIQVPDLDAAFQYLETTKPQIGQPRPVICTAYWSGRF